MNLENVDANMLGSCKKVKLFYHSGLHSDLTMYCQPLLWQSSLQRCGVELAPSLRSCGSNWLLVVVPVNQMRCVRVPLFNSLLSGAVVICCPLGGSGWSKKIFIKTEFFHFYFLGSRGSLLISYLACCCYMQHEVSKCSALMVQAILSAPCANS